MKTSIQLSHKVKKIIVHIIVGILLLRTFNITGIIYAGATDLLKYELYTYLVIIIGFYIHSLFLLPILTLKENPKRYLSFLIPVFLIATYSVTWIRAMQSSEMVITIEGDPLSPEYFFLQSEWIFQSLLVGLIVFLPVSIFSLLYHVLIIKKNERKKIASFKYSEFVVNSIIVLTILLFALTRSTDFLKVGLKNAMQFSIIIAIFYTNVFYLSKLILERKRYVQYLLGNAGLFLGLLLSTKFIYDLTWDKIVPYSNTFVILSIVTFFILVLSLVYSYIRLKLKNNQKVFDLKLNAKESELQLLKSQVNPHFLFNTLNTLYATALDENASKTATSIAKLGSLIRYMQNDIHKDFVLLSTEVQYLNDYIEIQKLRLAVEPEVIKSFHNINEEMISPGLFIPLVENAFKYGIHPTEKSTIELSISSKENRIHFFCQNHYDANQKIISAEQGFGIGIENVRQRLELVYPEKHTFDIEKTANIFTVRLTLEIQ